MLLALGWLALRAAIVEIMPPMDATAATIAPRAPDVILDRALVEFVTSKGLLSPSTMAQVEQTALRAPLDARPFLFAGARHLVRGENTQTARVFEAGRRLNPRQRWLRLLLLDRYLRTGEYREAAVEFAVLNRLVSGAQTPILAELAKMAQRPETRAAVRQTLALDPVLEESLLTTLARNNTEPRVLLELASPKARSVAAKPGGWGQAMVASQVEQGRYRAARELWTRVFRIPPEAARRLLYDPGIEDSRGLPPFGWDFAGGTAGAAAPRNGQLNVDYYGRDDATLASQLLVLTPGRYAFGYTLVGSTGTGLSWTFRCADGPKSAVLGAFAFPPAGAAAKRHAVSFTVPPNGCRAQWLRLEGTAAEFPTPVNVTVSQLDLRSLGARP